MRQTNDYEDQSGGLPLIYMALAVSAFVLMILVLVVSMNKDNKPSSAYMAQMQQKDQEEEALTQDSLVEDGNLEIGGSLVASDLDFWDMYPIEDTETKKEDKKTDEVDRKSVV